MTKTETRTLGQLRGALQPLLDGLLDAVAKLQLDDALGRIERALETGS